jgi:hypothetical protein
MKGEYDMSVDSKKTQNIKSINCVKWMGIAGFVIGVLTALSAAAKLPADGSEFPDTLVPFISGAILAIVGLVLWHMKERQLIKIHLSNQSATDAGNPIPLLKATLPALEQLAQKIDNLDCDQICHEVDHILDTFVLPFAEVRQQIINMFGMGAGAEILVTVAYGERMLNRVWSAASDAHLPEATTVFVDAHDAFKEALLLLDKSQK